MLSRRTYQPGLNGKCRIDLKRSSHFKRRASELVVLVISVIREQTRPVAGIKQRENFFAFIQEGELSIFIESLDLTCAGEGVEIAWPVDGHRHNCVVKAECS